jgi:glycosyltransferase involved in cell wall biosynthesis
MKTRILFVTWDGPEVNYLESLFLPIFSELKKHGVDFDVLQFRWGNKQLAEALRYKCQAVGVRYRWTRISRSPPVFGPFGSAIVGALEVRRAVSDFGSDAIMPRSLMPALSVLAAGGSRLRPIIFDADGLEADERVDFRRLRHRSPVYRLLRAVEARMVQQAESVLVRSEFAASTLSKRADISETMFHIVTNGRDARLFTPGTTLSRLQTRAELEIGNHIPLLVYSGSVGAQYRFDCVARTASAVRSRDPAARLLVLTGNPAEARAVIAAVDSSVLEMSLIRTVAAGKVPKYLAAADVGLSFRSKTFSSRAVSPIKTGEYLLCGVPVYGTAGIGRTDAAENAGVFADEAIDATGAAEWLLQTVLPQRELFRRNARRVGAENYSLERSVSDYLRGIEPLEEPLRLRASW